MSVGPWHEDVLFHFSPAARRQVEGELPQAGSDVVRLPATVCSRACAVRLVGRTAATLEDSHRLTRYHAANLGPALDLIRDRCGHLRGRNPMPRVMYDADAVRRLAESTNAPNCYDLQLREVTVELAGTSNTTLPSKIVPTEEPDELAPRPGWSRTSLSPARPRTITDLENSDAAANDPLLAAAVHSAHRDLIVNYVESIRAGHAARAADLKREARLKREAAEDLEHRAGHMHRAADDTAGQVDRERRLAQELSTVIEALRVQQIAGSYLDQLNSAAPDR